MKNNIKELYDEYKDGVDYRLSIYDDNHFEEFKKWFIETIKKPKELYRRIKRRMHFFWCSLKRSSKWFVRTWKSEDYDYIYLIEMMVSKLKDMRYQFDYIEIKYIDLRHQPVNIDDSDEVYDVEDRLESMDKAIEIGERLLADDYIHHTKRIDDWFRVYSPFSDLKMPDDMHAELNEIYRKANEDKEKDRNDFFNLIRDNHEYWWS